MNKKIRKIRLTARESEIALWAIVGFTNKEISSILSISHRTVETHFVNIKMKIGVKNRAQMAAYLIVNDHIVLSPEDLEDFAYISPG